MVHTIEYPWLYCSGQHATDYFSEYTAHKSSIGSYPENGYEWTKFREEFQASGESMYMTIESKYDVATGYDAATGAGKPKNRFCIWRCKDGVDSCPKSQLVRGIKIAESDHEDHVDDQGYYTDFNKHNVNQQACTDANDPACKPGGRQDCCCTPVRPH